MKYPLLGAELTLESGILEKILMLNETNKMIGQTPVVINGWNS